MNKFSRWTARIAFVSLIFILLASVSIIPLSDNHRGTVWPIPPHWAHHHVIAVIEMVIVYVVLGIALILVTVAFFMDLYERGWK